MLESHIHSLETALEDAATARATAEEHAERMKQVLSALVVHHRGEGKGIAEAEHFAKASNQYRTASDKWIVANYEYRRTDAKAEAMRLMQGQAFSLVDLMGRIPDAANPEGGLVRAMAGERFVGLCRLDSGLMKAERLVSQEGLQPVA